MSGRWFCRWFYPGLVVVLVILLWRCPWRPVPTPIEPQPGIMETAEGPANLVIEHVDAATWAPTNNRFHKAVDASRDSSYFRTGLLVQVGNFPETDFVLDSLALVDAAGAVVFSSRLADGDAFLWIDICGEWGGAPVSSTPIYPEEAFWLFPNATRTDGCGGSDAVSFPGKVTEPCGRGRQLHPDMESVRAVISYWQGANGFDARSTQPGGHAIDKRFEFRFRDDFRVQLWKLDDGSDADPSNDRFVPVDLPARVTQVVVAAKWRGGTTEGRTQEPPWWYP